MNLMVGYARDANVAVQTERYCRFTTRFIEKEQCRGSIRLLIAKLFAKGAMLKSTERFVQVSAGAILGMMILAI